MRQLIIFHHKIKSKQRVCLRKTTQESNVFFGGLNIRSQFMTLRVWTSTIEMYEMR